MYYDARNHKHKIMKIRPVGAELFHADGRTDRHNEANSHFSQFCERAYCHRVSTQLQLTNVSYRINDTRIFMLSAGFETAIPAITRVQAYVLDRKATGIG